MTAVPSVFSTTQASPHCGFQDMFLALQHLPSMMSIRHATIGFLERANSYIPIFLAECHILFVVGKIAFDGLDIGLLGNLVVKVVSQLMIKRLDIGLVMLQERIVLNQRLMVSTIHQSFGGGSGSHLVIVRHANAPCVHYFN